jgi:hypothetical protein
LTKKRMDDYIVNVGDLEGDDRKLESKTMVSLRRGLSVHKLLRMLVLSGDG